LSYCNQCRVKVDSYIKTCPLCSSAIQSELDVADDENENIYPNIEEEKTKKFKINGKQKRLLVWEITSVSLVVPFLIVMFTNVIIDKNFLLSWAKFPMVSLLLAWALVTFPLLLAKKPIFIIVGEVFSLMVFLSLIDLFDNWAYSWLYRLALPIIGIITVIISPVVVFSVKVKNKGWNIAAIVLFGIALINIGLDLTIMSYIEGKLTLRWSQYVAVPAAILTGFMLYLHYRIARKMNLKGVINITKRLKI